MLQGYVGVLLDIFVVVVVVFFSADLKGGVLHSIRNFQNFITRSDQIHQTHWTMARRGWFLCAKKMDFAKVRERFTFLKTNMEGPKMMVWKR